MNDHYGLQSNGHYILLRDGTEQAKANHSFFRGTMLFDDGALAMPNGNVITSRLETKCRRSTNVDFLHNVDYDKVVALNVRGCFETLL